MEDNIIYIEKKITVDRIIKLSEEKFAIITDKDFINIYDEINITTNNNNSYNNQQIYDFFDKIIYSTNNNVLYNQEKYNNLHTFEEKQDFLGDNIYYNIQYYFSNNDIKELNIMRKITGMIFHILFY